MILSIATSGRGLARYSALGAVLLLGGCASVDIQESIKDTNQTAKGFTQGGLQLTVSGEQQHAAEALATDLLSKPLDQDAAVRLALANSPRMQSIIASHWAEAASIANAGRIPNPIFGFERLQVGSELEITRTLSFGLIDVLTWPQRNARAKKALVAAHFGLTASVVDEVTTVRQTWVEAIAAAQQLDYARQVYASAEASAELAQRMKAAGNFSELARVRQQVFYSDAATRLANAMHATTVRREALIRVLGLTQAQIGSMQLPTQLPVLPDEPLPGSTVGANVVQQRIDIQMAQAAFEAAAEAQGLTLVTSFTDIEVGAIRETAFGEEGRQSDWGYEFSVTLPLFDWGGMRRDEMAARTLSAANELELTVRNVGSHMREQYSAYRTAYDIARHYQDEVIPLRQSIMDESMLRYNGMIIGVFELLADFRDQVDSVVNAIRSVESFWLANAALEASMAGRTQSSSSLMSVDAQSTGGGGEAH